MVPLSDLMIPAMGAFPAGVSAWLQAGHLHLVHNEHHRLNLSALGISATSPPRWRDGILYLCAVGRRNTSVVVCLDANGSVSQIKLPYGAVDVIATSFGWVVAIARMRDAHVKRFAIMRTDGMIARAFDVSPSWCVAGALRRDSVRWTLSRRGRRYFVEVSRSGPIVSEAIPIDGCWRRVRLRGDNGTTFPGWYRPSVGGTTAWIALHGGPRQAWDSGLPRWLELAGGTQDAILLLESPGSVGYGPGLLREWFDPRASERFPTVLGQAVQRIRRTHPGVSVIVAGESDGAAWASTGIFNGIDNPPDGYVLLNGEYELAAVRDIRASVLVITSACDDVVDAHSAQLLVQQARCVGARVETFEVDGGHRWGSDREHATVGHRIRRFARDLQISS